MNVCLLLFPRLCMAIFRALDQDKSKESYASYKFLSDSTSHDQRTSRSSYCAERYLLFIAATQSHVIETMHAVALPLGASLSLIIMFFFFDSLQTVFIICTASTCSTAARPQNVTRLRSSLVHHGLRLSSNTVLPDDSSTLLRQYEVNDASIALYSLH